MSGLNKAEIIGRLGRDPELKYTQSGKAVCSFSVATSDTWGKGEERQEKTEWHNIVCWEHIAEICAEHLKKGSQVYLSGKMQNRKWQDKDGLDKYTFEIVANSVVFLDSKSDTSGGYKNQGNTRGQNKNHPQGENTNDSEDIPF